MSIKTRALEVYNQHIHLASTDGRLFRKTVMDQLMAEFEGASLAAVATHYNNAKKATPVEGLGRAPVPKGVRKPGSKSKAGAELQPDNECFTVVEVMPDGTVGRNQSFLMQGDASEKFDEKVEAWPNSTWVMIQGLGPCWGENFRLAEDEKEIKRYSREEVAA